MNRIKLQALAGAVSFASLCRLVSRVYNSTCYFKRYAILLTVFSLLLFAASASAEARQKKIDDDEVGWDYVLVGSLGRPLFEVFEIKGRIVHEEAKSHKEGNLKYVEVESVKGKNLKEKIRVPLWDAPRDIPVGKLLDFEVTEQGRLEKFVAPNLSISDSVEENSRQVVYSGISIIKIKK